MFDNILFQTSTKQKNSTKLNESTCIDSDTTDSDSTDSEIEDIIEKPTKGCIQSCGAGFNKVPLWFRSNITLSHKDNIIITDFSATIDDRPTEICEESPIVLR